MRGGTPNSINALQARGSAASEVLVANAIVAGSATASTNRASGIRAMREMGKRIRSKNASNAQYPVSSNFPNGSKTPIPMWPTVYAMAAPTPMGAKYITRLVNENMVSVSDSKNFSMDVRLASG